MLKRQTITRQVTEYLLDLIKRGEIKPGDKFPTEKELTEKLGVSRTCVREAMKSLECLELVRVRPRVGAVLLEPRPNAFLTTELLAGDDGDHVDFLLELRKIVEVGIASLAAERATDEDLAELQQVLDVYKREFQAGQVSSTTDMLFHKTLVLATKNPLLNSIYEMMSPHLAKALEEVAELPDEHESTIREHTLILKAIRQRDPRKAQAAMRTHLGTVERYRRVVAAHKTAATGV